MSKHRTETRKFEDIGVEERGMYIRAASERMSRTISSKDTAQQNVVQIAEDLFYDDNFEVLME